MIKEAIKEYKSLAEANKIRATEKYESKNKGQSGGAVTRLKNTAAEFMAHNEERQKDYRGTGDNTSTYKALLYKPPVYSDHMCIKTILCFKIGFCMASAYSVWRLQVCSLYILASAYLYPLYSFLVLPRAV